MNAKLRVVSTAAFLLSIKSTTAWAQADVDAAAVDPAPAAPVAPAAPATPAAPVAPVAIAPAIPVAPIAAPAPGPATPTEPQAAPFTPFGYADFTWMNGNSRQKDYPLDGKVFSGEFTTDANYTFSFARPKDHSLVGSTTSARSGEVQLEQIGVGGDFHYEGMRGRIFTQFGLYSTTQPRNDASPSRGQGDLADAYRYLSEAYGGYHIDKFNGINVDAGIFASYIGLCSYYNFENWVYQPSFVSDNTPFFFNGIRVQTFPSEKLKVELWLINGWQSYGMFNEQPGVGTQILWRPNGNLSLVTNAYAGADTLGNPSRIRVHSDSSIEMKYREKPDSVLTRAAFSVTADIGCEQGGGVTCAGGSSPAQNFLGIMAYNRFWFGEKFGLTIGGGAINNPGRYIVLLPPINGANATSGTPYFTEAPGDKFTAIDGTLTLDFMPNQFITFRTEYSIRHASVPYFAGRGGITPPGGNQGAAGSTVAGWSPDLQRDENRMQFVVMTHL